MSEPGSMIRTLSGRQSARNFHSYVITEIGLAIASGQFAVGMVLPGDADLMDRYGVSRTVLREALKTIEAKGLVEARAKVGTRVLPRNRWNFFDRQVLGWIQLSGPDAAFLESFVELRVGIETQIATLAAARRSPEQLRMLHYWNAQRTATTAMPEPHALAEFEFHRILCEASQNPFLRACSALVEFGVVRALIPRLAANIQDLATEKADYYAALTAAVTIGDAQLSAQAMTTILELDRNWTLASAAALSDAAGI